MSGSRSLHCFAARRILAALALALAAVWARPAASGSAGSGRAGASPAAGATRTAPAAGSREAAPRASAAAGGGADVLLVTIDTLRADAPGFGGNRHGTTPVLDRLAAGGRVFTTAHAHNVVTLPSHTNILTGLYPYQHGVRDNIGFRLPPEVPTLATVLHEAGYATGAFVGAYPLDSEFGLARGFDVYDDHYPKGGNADEFVFPERRGDLVVAPALAWWRRQRGAAPGKHRFMWVHLFDPHAPYTPAEPFATRFAGNPYLGEVAAADAYLEPLLAPFLAGAEPPTLIVVTGDHGEALGEHGEETHGLFAYEPTLHVPLLLWGAGVEPGRDPAPVRHVDIFPTVLQAAGVAAPPLRTVREGQTRIGLSAAAFAGRGTSGRSLLGRRASNAAAESSYFEALSATFNRGWAPLRGVLAGGKKLISLPLPELYNLPRDPGEAANLIHRERQLAQGLRARLPAESAGSLPAGAAARAVSAAEAARMASLGYLAGSSPARRSYGPEDDPKRLLVLDRELHQVIDLYSRGKLDEAVALARRVVAARPGMALGQSILAQALLQSGKKEEALAAMRQARGRGAASEALLCQLGLTLAETGRTGEALGVLQPLAEDGVPRTMDALALALSEAGRQDEAAAVLERVLARFPDDATAIEQQGLVELRRGRWEAAAARSRRALELNDRLPRAWNDLGVALYQLHQPAAALDAWQHAVDLDGHLLDALWNLGTKAAEQGRAEQARRALGRFIALAPAAEYAGDLAKARALLRGLGQEGREGGGPSGGGPARGQGATGTVRGKGIDGGKR
ncbi:MAG TPA: sulfatase-like hydrolase/transferase [Thermoanaerobaculia bacterium]|nr:sulfatase-like hydrolase/transferase [Thermoanaerobaculia bacterium]